MQDENGYPGFNDEVDGGDDMAMYACDDMVSTVDMESPMSLSISDALARITVDRVVSHSIRSISSHCGYLEEEDSKKIAVSKSSCSTPPVNDVGFPPAVGDVWVEESEKEESEKEAAMATNTTTSPRMGPRNGFIGHAPSSTLLEQLQLRWGESTVDTRIPIGARDTANDGAPPPVNMRMDQPLQLREHGGSEEEVMTPSSGEDYGGSDPPKFFRAFSEHDPQLMLERSEAKVMTPASGREDKGGHDPPINQTPLCVVVATTAPTISRLGANSEEDAMETIPTIGPSSGGNNRAEATSLLGKKPSQEQPHAELNMINQFLTGFLEDEVVDTLSSLRHSRASSRPGSRTTSHGSGATNNMRLCHPFETHTATTTAGDGSIAASLNTMIMGGNKQQFGGQLDPSLLSLIRAQVRKVLDDELPSRRPASNPVSPTSHNRLNSTTANEEHAQLIDLLRKKDEDAISLREELTKKDEVIGVCEKKIRNQAEAIADLESRHTQLTEELTGSRMAERNAIVTAEMVEQRHDETCKKLSEARKLTIEEGEKTQRHVDRMKAEQKIELDAYRKALAAEESRVIALKETVKLLEKDLRLNRISSKGALGGSPRWDTSVDKSRKRKPKKATQIPELKDIYVPLSERTAPRLPRVPSNNALLHGGSTTTHDNHMLYGGGSHDASKGHYHPKTEYHGNYHHHPPLGHTMLPKVQQKPRMFELTQAINSVGGKKGATRMFQVTNCSTALDHYYNP